MGSPWSVLPVAVAAAAAVPASRVIHQYTSG